MIAFIAGFSLLAWCYLTFFHHNFWRADQRLPLAQDMVAWPSVTAIVPARNEAPTIAACVSALRAQNYPGRFSIIVVDDASTDGTGEIAVRAGGGRVSLIQAPPLAEGWTGKLAALNAGLAHVNQSAAVPDYVWFTDADIVHAPPVLTRLISKAVNDGRDLVSLMVRLHCESPWERLLIPAFIFFFQMLYPFPAVNSRRSRTAAAAGGCVLLRRDRLVAAGGLEAIRGEIIDDCALAAIVKRSGARIWLGLADDSRSLRSADTLAPLWIMVRRTAFTQLRYSTPLLVGAVLGLALVFLGPVIVILGLPWHGRILATFAGIGALALIFRCYSPTLRDYGRSPWECLGLPMAAALYAAMTVSSAVAYWRHEGGQWKGRHYGPSAGSRNLSKSL
jgi:hopene-associated glycosyltransferase HpnB